MPLMRLFSTACCLLFALSLTSCFVGVENQIIPDEKVDRRLVGPWVGIPLFDTEEEEDAAQENSSLRTEDDIGCNGYFIVGETDSEQLEILNIEQFSEEGVMMFKGRNGKTREYKGRNFLLFDLELEMPGRESRDEDAQHYVMEYQIKEDGTLWLWFLYVDSLDDALKEHPMEVAIEDKPFGKSTVKGTSEEILEFYSNPKVLKLLASAGRYQKLEVPQNARLLYNSPSLKK